MMILVNVSKWVDAYNLKGQKIKVQTYTYKSSMSGKLYTAKKCVRPKRQIA